MNYSEILNALSNASLFELYRLEQAIRRVLEDGAVAERCSDIRAELAREDAVARTCELIESLIGSE